MDRVSRANARDRSMLERIHHAVGPAARSASRLHLVEREVASSVRNRTAVENSDCLIRTVTGTGSGASPVSGESHVLAMRPSQVPFRSGKAARSMAGKRRQTGRQRTLAKGTRTTPMTEATRDACFKGWVSPAPTRSRTASAAWTSRMVGTTSEQLHPKGKQRPHESGNHPAQGREDERLPIRHRPRLTLVEEELDFVDLEGRRRP